MFIQIIILGILAISYILALGDSCALYSGNLRTACIIYKSCKGDNCSGQFMANWRSEDNLPIIHVEEWNQCNEQVKLSWQEGYNKAVLEVRYRGEQEILRDILLIEPAYKNGHIMDGNELLRNMRKVRYLV